MQLTTRVRSRTAPRPRSLQSADTRALACSRPRRKLTVSEYASVTGPFHRIPLTDEVAQSLTGDG